jgi:hypothetical protein
MASGGHPIGALGPVTASILKVPPFRGVKAAAADAAGADGDALAVADADGEDAVEQAVSRMAAIKVRVRATRILRVNIFPCLLSLFNIQHYCLNSTISIYKVLKRLTGSRILRSSF